MNIAIIGGGVTGLTAAYELTKHGHWVTVFEKEKTLGGLAGGFTRKGWLAGRSPENQSKGEGWTLEYFYHHFFTNDDSIFSLAKELGLESDLLSFRPVTGVLVKCSAFSRQLSDNETGARGVAEKIAQDDKRIAGPSNFFCEQKRGEGVAYNEDVERGKRTTGPVHEFQLDSPLNLLTFPLLSPIDKLRTAALLGFCKVNPFWQPLEKITAEQFFKTIGGARAWTILWEPLMIGKFGDYADQVPASWLWARFHKRSMKLGYFRGGFATLINTLAETFNKQGGIIHTNATVTTVRQDVRSKKYEVRIKQHVQPYLVNHILRFDNILITTPSATATKIIKFPKSYEQNLMSIPHLFAQTLILQTDKPVLEKTYWLNIVDRSFPFVAIVAHTNMVDKKQYGGNHITYIGNYLPQGHPFLKMTKQQLLRKFLPYIKKINPSFVYEPRTINYELFTASNAQPVHTINYSKKVPAMKTPINGIYLANMDSVYPWDRGTNYAVDLGQKAASTISEN